MDCDQEDCNYVVTEYDSEDDDDCQIACKKQKIERSDGTIIYTNGSYLDAVISEAVCLKFNETNVTTTSGGGCGDGNEEDDEPPSSPTFKAFTELNFCSCYLKFEMYKPWFKCKSFVDNIYDHVLANWNFEFMYSSEYNEFDYGGLDLRVYSPWVRVLNCYTIDYYDREVFYKNHDRFICLRNENELIKLVYTSYCNLEVCMYNLFLWDQHNYYKMCYDFYLYGEYF